MDPATGYLIGAGISAIGAMGGSAIAASGSRSATNAAYDRAGSLWQRQVDYNTPANQVKRYLAAGLNPNLVYGQVTSGNASTMPDVPYSNGSAEIANGLSLTLDKIGQMFGQYAARKEAKALQESMEEQRQNQLTIQRLNIQLLEKNLEEREVNLIAKKAGMAQPVMGSPISPSIPQPDWIDRANSVADSFSRGLSKIIPGYGAVYRGVGQMYQPGNRIDGLFNIGRGIALAVPSVRYGIPKAWSYLKKYFTRQPVQGKFYYY